MSLVATHHIELRDNRDGQPRAYIAGTRVRVQDIYVACEVHRQTPDQVVASLPHLTLGQVHAALAYYFDHREEVLEEVRQDTHLAQELRGLIGTAQPQGAGSADDAVSP